MLAAYVYSVTNLVNGKKYIGKTIDFERRIKEHLKCHAVGGGRLLKSAFKKYGLENFKFEIIQECETEEIAYEFEHKAIVEQHSLAPDGYNLCEGGTGCFRPTEDVRARMSASQNKRFSDPEEIQRLRQAQRGVKKSEQTKQRMRKPKSEEHRAKLRELLEKLHEANHIRRVLNGPQHVICKDPEARRKRLIEIAQRPHVKEAKRQAQLKRWAKYHAEQAKKDE